MTNHHLSCNHMSLAESLEDSTKAVIHEMILDDNAKEVINNLQAYGKSIHCITSVM